MKKIILCSLCATITYATVGEGSLEQRVKQLEERLSRIEKALSTGEKQPMSPVEVSVPKPISAPSIEGRDVEIKINAFLKEHLQSELGDPIEKYPEQVYKSSKVYKHPEEVYRSTQSRKIPVVKKFHSFDKAVGTFRAGKLLSVFFYCEFDKKYSLVSCQEKIDQTLANLSVTLGLPEGTFARKQKFYRTKDRRYVIDCFYEGQMSYVSSSKWGFGIKISNTELRDRLFREAAAMGQTLP